MKGPGPSAHAPGGIGNSPRSSGCSWWPASTKLWSPEQISGRLRLLGLLSISHETIYRYVWKDRELGGSLYGYLRQHSKQLRKRYRAYDSRGRLAGKRSISERPPGAENRSRFGHLEGDTVIGTFDKHCILTLVCRKSGYAMIGKLYGRTTSAVNRRARGLLRKSARRTRSRSTTAPVDDAEINRTGRTESAPPHRCTSKLTLSIRHGIQSAVSGPRFPDRWTSRILRGSTEGESSMCALCITILDLRHGRVDAFAAWLDVLPSTRMRATTFRSPTLPLALSQVQEERPEGT